VSHTIQELTARQARQHLEGLAELLVDVVRDGASVNFMLPFGHDDALRFWRSVLDRVEAGEVRLLAAFREGGSTARSSSSQHPSPTSRTGRTSPSCWSTPAPGAWASPAA
jgi:hypothetical protein